MAPTEPITTIITLPLTNFNVASLTLLLLLAILGAVYLHTLLVRQSCVCQLCTSTYLIQDQIGRGGFGQVFSVQHKSERSVGSYVMKKIPVHNLNEANIVLSEAKMLRTLEHHHIVKYESDFIHVELPAYGVTGLEPQLYVCIVMEKCTGGDLKGFIAKTRDLKEATYLENDVALRMMVEIASALAYCHSHFVVHRDIKPHNIFLNENLECRLGDFGLSRRWKVPKGEVIEAESPTLAPPPSPLLTAASTLTTCGTEFYRPPELFINGNKGIDYMKVDVWCLGLLFVELLTLEYVFEWVSEVRS